MTVFTIISYLCWYDYVSITIMPHLLVWIVQKCLKSWLILYFMKLSVKCMCLKVPPWRSCKTTCPALLISEFVSWMMMSLQSCTRGTVNHRPHVSSCVLPQCVHPDISHRDNCWCNRLPVSTRSPKSPQWSSSIIYCYNWLQNRRSIHWFPSYTSRFSVPPWTGTRCAESLPMPNFLAS